MNPPTITTDQANTFINVTLPIYFSIALAIGGAIITLWQKLSALKATVDTHAVRLNTQSDRIHDLALNTPTESTTVQVQPAPAPTINPGALSIIALFAILMLSGCASDGSLTAQGQQDVAIGTSVLNAAIDTYVKIDSAKTTGKPMSKAAIVQLAKNDLNGVLVQMQANVGKTPDDANKGDGVAIGAANPNVGQAIQGALPPFTIDQSTINQIAKVAK